MDTNIVVSGLIGADLKSPPARILNAMLEGDLLYLMSKALLAEYSDVLRRPRIARLHGLSDGELDRLLTELTANAVWRQPTTDPPAPESGDDHLWALLSSWPRSRLITGDRLLVENPPATVAVVTPRQVVDSFLEEREDGIVLQGNKGSKQSWEDTYRAMARDDEDWSDLDSTVADGLD